MKKTRMIIVIIVFCAAAALFALPASRAEDAKPLAQAKSRLSRHFVE